MIRSASLRRLAQQPAGPLSSGTVADLISAKASRTQIAASLDNFTGDLGSVTRALVAGEYLPVEDVLQQKLLQLWSRADGDAKIFASLAHAVKRGSLGATPQATLAMLGNFSQEKAEQSPAVVADFLAAFAWNFSEEISDHVQSKLTPLYEFLEDRKFEGISDQALLRLVDAAGARLGDLALVGNICVAISKRNLEISDFLSFFGVLGRLEFFDPRFLDHCNRKFLDSSDQFSVHDIVQAFNHLPRYTNVLDKNLEISSRLISIVTPKISTLAEGALVNVLIGLHRRRPGALTPEISDFLRLLKPRIIQNFSVPGKATGICLLSKMMGPCDRKFLSEGIQSIVSAKQLDRLSVSHTQQLFAILAHNRHSLAPELVEKSARVLIDHLASVVHQITPVHAVSLLAAMSALRLRDERALHALVSVLVGRSRPARTKAELVVQGPVIGNLFKEFPIKLAACIQTLTPPDGSVDLTHLACTVHAIYELDAYSEISVHLILVIRALLLKSGLHNLRAGSLANLIQVWAEIGNFFPDQAVTSVDAAVESHFDSHPNDKFRAKIPIGLSKQQFLALLIENLRRHENYIRTHSSALRRVKLSLLAVEGAADEEFTRRILALEGEAPADMGPSTRIGNLEIRENFRVHSDLVSTDVALFAVSS